MAQLVTALSILFILAVFKPEGSPPSVIAASSSEENLDASDCLDEDVVSNNKTYCNDIQNYPKEEHLEELLEKKFSKFKGLFTEDSIKPEFVKSRKDPNTEYFCRSQEVVIYPKAGQTEKYGWLAIINSNKFKQGIRIEQCLNPYMPCGKKVGLSLPLNYQTSCEQHYIYRTLVAYDSKTNKVVRESFKLPSCCKCVLRNKKIK